MKSDKLNEEVVKTPSIAPPGRNRVNILRTRIGAAQAPPVSASVTVHDKVIRLITDRAKDADTQLATGPTSSAQGCS